MPSGLPANPAGEHSTQTVASKRECTAASYLTGPRAEIWDHSGIVLQNDSMESHQTFLRHDSSVHSHSGNATGNNGGGHEPAGTLEPPPAVNVPG